MNTRRLPHSIALLITALAVAPACGDDASPTPTAVAGSAGAGGKAVAGAAGKPSGSGAAGVAGQPSHGGSGGAGGSASGGHGASSASAGTTSAGNDAGGGSSGGSSAGTGGGAGGSGYPTDAHPGPNVVPTSCVLAHGAYGCCGPDGNAYRGDYAEGAVKELCGAAFPCGWLSYAGRFGCGGDQPEAPSSIPSRSCGAPAIPQVLCPESYCHDEDGCDPAVWGAGARCRLYGGGSNNGHCVRCVADADCPVDRYCDPDGGGTCLARVCATDGECKAQDASLPACNLAYHVCQECTTDSHCSGVGKNGCFLGKCRCKDDVACVLSPLGHRCDEVERTCGCQQAADCPDTAPICADGLCSVCATDAQCATMPNKPYCVTKGSIHECVACRKDTDCASAEKPSCVEGTCVAGCQTSFTCPPEFPVCASSDDGPGVCTKGPNCAGDDEHETGDDNPLTAQLSLGPDAVITGKVCGLPGERDYFPVTLAQTGDVVLTVTSDEPGVFVSLSDASGRLLGLALHGTPRSLHVRAVAAGTYYAAVGVAVHDGTATAAAYSLQRAGGGSPCVSDASCGDVTPTEIYRGHCDSPTGACVFIEGNHGLGPTAPCDDDTDCKSGFCSGYAFAGKPGERSRCSAPCDGPGPLGQEPMSELCGVAGLDAQWVCTTFENVNRCLPRCKTDDDCPLVDLLATPKASNPWLHMTCSAKGHCESYE